VCKTCNSTGGINIEHDWGIQFEPCPDFNCDYNTEKGQQEVFAALDKLMKQISDES